MDRFPKQTRSLACSTLIVSFALTALGILFSAPARADFYLHGWEDGHRPAGEFRLVPELMDYTSKNNFDASGTSVAPSASFKSYSRIQVDANGGYGLDEHFTVFGRASWARIAVDHLTQGGNSYGFVDQSIGVNARVYRGNLQLDLQLQLDFPAYSNVTRTDGTPYLGDATTDFTFGAFVALPLAPSRRDRFQLEGGLGYTFRNASFSSALPWSIGVDYSPYERGIMLNAKILGLQSLRTDPNASAGLATPASQGAGGSFVVNAINPSMISGRIEGGYRFNPNFSAYIGLMQSFWGQASPNGLTILGGLQASWGSPGESISPRKNAAEMTPKEYGKANQGFVDYSLDAAIQKTNDRLNLLKINKGSQDGVEVGQYFDIFAIKAGGVTSEPIARGKVTTVREDSAALSVIEYYKEIWIEEGFIARRLMQQ